jgi:hypothetical protein
MVIERRGIRPDVGRQVLARDAEPLIASGLRPLIERVPCGGVEHVGRGGPRAGARKCPFSRADQGPSVFVHEFGCASQHRELHLRLAFTAQHGDAILAGFRHLDPRRRRVDAVGQSAALAGKAQTHAPFEQPHDFVRLEINHRVTVDVQRAAVSEQDLDAAALRPDSITGEKRHRPWR